VNSVSNGEPSGAWMRAGIPCRAANPPTAYNALVTGRSGVPAASVLFARPVKPPAARIRHWPSGSSTSAGQATAHARSSSSIGSTAPILR
jgi:hypothetical protein